MSVRGNLALYDAVSATESYCRILLRINERSMAQISAHYYRLSGAAYGAEAFLSESAVSTRVVIVACLRHIAEGTEAFT